MASHDLFIHILQGCLTHCRLYGVKIYVNIGWGHGLLPDGVKIYVNIGWGHGLLPDGTKPWPQPMLTYCHLDIQDAMKFCSSGTSKATLKNKGKTDWDPFYKLNMDYI